MAIFNDGILQPDEYKSDELVQGLTEPTELPKEKVIDGIIKPSSNEISLDELMGATSPSDYVVSDDKMSLTPADPVASEGDAAGYTEPGSNFYSTPSVATGENSFDPTDERYYSKSPLSDKFNSETTKKEVAASAALDTSNKLGGTGVELPEVTNDSTIGGEVKRVVHDYLFRLPSMDEFLDNLGSKFQLGKVSQVDDDLMNAVKSTEKIHSDTGKGYLQSAIIAGLRLLPDVIKTDQSKPLVNQFIDKIPVLGYFTKTNYSLDNNHKTYASEVNDKYLATGKNYGLYYNAYLATNHFTPAKDMDYLVRKMSGDPSASESDRHVLLQFKDMMVSVRDPKTKTTFLTNKYIDSRIPSAAVDYTDSNKTVGKGFNSYTPVFTRKIHETKDAIGGGTTYSTNYKVIGMNEEGTARKIHEHETRGPFRAGALGVGGPILTSSNYKDQATTNIGKYWSRYLIVTSHAGDVRKEGASYYNPPTSYNSLENIKPFKNVSEYINYQMRLSENIKSKSHQEAVKDSEFYGQLPYNWHQVFSDFELGSNANWNLSFSEFTGKNKSISAFVPSGRPTYGKWHYMPILNYNHVDKMLQTTSIEAARDLSLQIPVMNVYNSTLQVTFLDDRYSRIYNWFSKYVNTIYSTYQGFTKPYKNCCLKCTIDRLDWDRTVLQRNKYAVIPIEFNQQSDGDSEQSYKTVTVTFSVVANVFDEGSSNSGHVPLKGDTTKHLK